LRRRVYYLNFNNSDIEFRLLLNENNIDLYDKTTLFDKRPDNEVIRKSLIERGGLRIIKKVGKRLSKIFIWNGL
jgi:hypothetical protein